MSLRFAEAQSELRDRIIRGLELAGLKGGTAEVYIRAVCQLAGCHMISPDRLSERQVQHYILYVRDDLGAAKGTFEPMLARCPSRRSTRSRWSFA